MISRVHEAASLAEVELCNLAWADQDSFEPFSFGWKDSVIAREMPIAHGLRPDFIQAGLLFGTPTIMVHEFKIRAGFKALDQVARYRRLVDEHATELSMRLWQERAIMTNCPKVSFSLVATEFDLGMLEAAEAMDVWLWRVELHSDGYEVLQVYRPGAEVPPYEKLDEAFLKSLLDFGFARMIPAMKCEVPNG